MMMVDKKGGGCLNTSLIWISIGFVVTNDYAMLLRIIPHKQTTQKGLSKTNKQLIGVIDQFFRNRDLQQALLRNS